MMRSVPKDTMLGNVAIPAGATVLLLWGAGNRDPNEFERPDEIDSRPAPSRRHVLLGAESNHCVGCAAARVEARNVLTVPARAHDSITLDPGHSPELVAASWGDAMNCSLCVLHTGRSASGSPMSTSLDPSERSIPDLTPDGSVSQRRPLT